MADPLSIRVLSSFVCLKTKTKKIYANSKHGSTAARRSMSSSPSGLESLRRTGHHFIYPSEVRSKRRLSERMPKHRVEYQKRVPASIVWQQVDAVRPPRHKSIADCRGVAKLRVAATLASDQFGIRLCPTPTIFSRRREKNAGLTFSGFGFTGNCASRRKGRCVWGWCGVWGGVESSE